MRKVSDDIKDKIRKAKRIEFAPQTKLMKHKDLVDEFMLKIFKMKPGNYFISDESSIYDFSNSEDDDDKTVAKIAKVFGVDIDEVKYGNIAKIIAKIAKEKKK